MQRQHADGSYSLTCGGTVISYRGRVGVLTGAHCVTDDLTAAALPTEQIRLAVGSTAIDTGRIITVTSIAVPDGWDWGAPGPDGHVDQVNDWAVLLPSNPRGLHPITITGLAEATRLRLLGWGSTTVSGQGPLPRRLQQLDGNTIVDPSNCAGAFISTGEICVKSPEGAGPCYGDSGTAALTRAHGQWALRGSGSRIVNLSCGTGNSVYTDAWYFHTEIAQMLAGTHPRRRTTTLTATTSNRNLWPAFPDPAT